MNQPIQYFLVGLPFSGKTTLSKILERKLKYKRVNIDEIKEEIGIGNVDDDQISDETWKKILEEANCKVISYLREGYNVITETAWLTKKERDKAREIPAREGYQTKAIFVDVSEETARKRLLENRKTKKRFDITDKIFNEAIKEFEKPMVDESMILYDDSIPIDQWIKDILL